MSHPIRTLFQRLNETPEGLNFDYMGAAEYEFGSASAALDLLVNDLGAPQAVVQTNLVLTQDRSPFSHGFDIDKKAYSWKRLTKHQKENEILRREEVKELLDGKPLLMRYVPAITRADSFEDIMSAQTLNDLDNKGGMWRDGTKGWLGLSPIPCILYHHKHEAEVDQFLERIAEIRKAKQPDDIARAEAAILRVMKNSLTRSVLDEEGTEAVLRNLKTGEPALADEAPGF